MSKEDKNIKYKTMMKKRGFILSQDNKQMLAFKRRSEDLKGILQVYFNHERKNVTLTYQKANHRFGNIYDEIHLAVDDLRIITVIAKDLYKEGE